MLVGFDGQGAVREAAVAKMLLIGLGLPGQGHSSNMSGMSGTISISITISLND